MSSRLGNECITTNIIALLWIAPYPEHGTKKATMELDSGMPRI